MAHWTYPILAHVVNGDLFFLGMFMLCAASVVPNPLGWTRSCLRIGVIAGLTLTVLSATLQPIWAYVLLFLLAVARWWIPWRRGLGVALIAALMAQAAFMTAVEAHCRLRPIIPRPRNGEVFVIGDSLSMWADRPDQNWPGIFGERAGLNVHNFSFGGAKAGSALPNAERVNIDGALVILEIGGNDLLGGTPPAAFRTALAQLLMRVCKDNRRVVMFELPLPPSYNAYGKAQRDLAKQFGVTLIPKRYFAPVLAGQGATVDGLHLSPQGHIAMAETIVRLLAKPGVPN